MRRVVDEGADVLVGALVFASAAAGAQTSLSVAPTAIIVTGERVNRSTRDTASSVAVASDRDIEAAGAHRVQQMLALIPNVQLGNGSQGPTIRGLDTTGPLQALPAFLGGNRPRTTIVVDGRAVTFYEFVFGAGPLWDVERVEVYRSPQTTTQGVNSIAGAIFVVSEDPKLDQVEFKGRLIAGDYRTRQASAAASAALSDDVAVRVAGDWRYSRTTSWIAPVMSGADPNHEVAGIARAKLLVQPRGLPATRALITLTHSLSEAPQTVGVHAPFRDRRDPAPNYGVFRVRADALTASLRQGVGKSIITNLVLSTGRSHARRFALAGFGEARNNGKDWSGEFVANWKPKEPVNAIAGFSQSHLQLRQEINLSLLSGLMGSFRDWQDGTGLFGELDVHAAPRVTFTAGLRYQQDRQRRIGGLITNSFSVPIDFIGNFHALLPKLSLAYDLSRDWRAGLLLQKAYNPGGTTIRFDTARPDDFAAETLWDTELFVRGTLADNKIQLSANLFGYAMRNAQRADPITIFTPTGKAVGFANLFNVPKARSRGLEATANWRASPALSAQLALGWLDTKIGATDAESAAYQGKQFDRSPHFSGALSVNWRPAAALQLSAQIRHHSPYYSDNANSPSLLIDGGTIADARAEYRLKRVSLFAQLHNLFDEFAMRIQTTPTSGEAEDPRRISVGIEGRF